jgi:hypothetical protein
MLPPEVRRVLENDIGVSDTELKASIEELATIVAGLVEDDNNEDADHAALRQLIHFIDNGPAEGFASAYRENTGGAFPSSVIWWTSPAKVSKIVEKNITYTGAFPTSFEWKMYDTDGSTVLAVVTDTITYSGAFESSRTRTIG